MNTILVCGGEIEDSFALSVFDRIRPDCIIGIDRGLEFCYKYNIVPNYILGDFDSISPKILSFYEGGEIPVKRFQPEKDATDTRIGLELAMKLGSQKIFLLGATGGRLDHYMANVKSLLIPMEQGVQAWILDSQNAITVLDQGTKLKKDRQFGKYVSFFTMGDRVEGVTLTGFKYPLKDHTLVNSDEIGVSNEIQEDSAEITFRSGVVLMIMSKDRNI
ncbi:MAG TPA: thiamine diphosphokinase [Candidatus Blautia merdigallinarum]|uniref:Thiamine diphosphokinase n=1 Tax=Candidatus Blautia merdigallinarum TaxID=2838495 RepID=A0A9D2SKK7_9FIRM|nr:thiamine diphosphokinase [Candidatus Blautia merdigallinarum]